MASKDRPHLRDEAGSLLIAFELGGAEELTVASGGTAIAALVCRQSHKSPETNSSSRGIASRKHVFDANDRKCRWRQVAVAFSHCRIYARRLRLEQPRKRRRCAPPSTHTCHHHLNPNTYITHTFLSLADTPYRHTTTPNRYYQVDTTSPFFRGIGLLSIYISGFVLCPLSPDPSILSVHEYRPLGSLRLLLSLGLRLGV